MLRLRSLPKRLLLAAFATAIGLVLGEALYRLFARPMIGRGTIFAANGIEVPLGEIGHFMTRMNEFNANINQELEGPHGMLQANLKLRMGYTPRPRWDYFDERGCIAVDTNSLGFRDAEFPVGKRPQELRILALGDSMTYGQGVRLDLTWPQQLEARLRAERSTPVEVINAGFAAGPGISSPDGYDRWVAAHGIRFAPDVVLVGFCLNDMGAVGMITYPVVPLEPVLGGHSKLLDRVVQLWRQRQARQQQTDFAARIQAQPGAWQGSQRGLLALRDLLEPQGIPLVVAVFPMMSQLEPELYPCRPLHAMVTEFCARERIRCLDLLPDFLGRTDTDYWVHESDQHPNHIGYRIIADRLHDWLRAQGLLEPRRG